MNVWRSSGRNNFAQFFLRHRGRDTVYFVVH